MTISEGVVPGPLVEWKPGISTDTTRVRLEDFPPTIYPAAHLDSLDYSEEAWGDRCRGYPHIEGVNVDATLNYGASGNCYFTASRILISTQSVHLSLMLNSFHSLIRISTVLAYSERPSSGIC